MGRTISACDFLDIKRLLAKCLYTGFRCWIVLVIDFSSRRQFSNTVHVKSFDMMAELKETGEFSLDPKGSDSDATPESIRSNADAERVAFLSSFSPEEDKAIRRKVDWRFLWLIGCM
jgi:hypothetical protein